MTPIYPLPTWAAHQKRDPHTKSTASLLNHVNVILSRGTRSLSAILLRSPIIFHLSVQLLLSLLRSAIFRQSLPTSATSIPPLPASTWSSSVSSVRQGTAGSAVLARDIAVNVAWCRSTNI
jgi:hypothetical protein